MRKLDQCHDWSLRSEYIAAQRQTWGTETSKYPQEYKEISIPKVAASELGIAQTGPLWSGVVGLNI